MKRIFALALAVALMLPIFKVDALSVSAKSAIIINADTGEIIWEHNATEQLPMASTTKIMTGLLLCEAGRLEREITVTAEMLRVEGSSMGLLAGDKVTLHDLLYGLMLASGNDAANVIAFTLGSTIDGFVRMMNQKAAELGLENTNFATPSGLDGDGHYTTAKDLAMLTREALKNPQFAQAVASASATLNYGNPPYKRTLTNHNRLLKSFEGAIGVKTGFTKKAGRCLVSAAEREGKRVIAVTLNDPDDWQDHAEMLEYGLNAIRKIELISDKPIYNLPVIGSGQELKIEIEPLSLNVLDDEGFEVTVMLPPFVYAPVKEGEGIGRAVYSKNGQVFLERALYADVSIEAEYSTESPLEGVIKNIKTIFLNIWEK